MSRVKKTKQKNITCGCCSPVGYIAISALTRVGLAAAAHSLVRHTGLKYSIAKTNLTAARSEKRVTVMVFSESPLCSYADAIVFNGNY